MWGAVLLQGLFSGSCISWLNYGEVNELLGWPSFFWSNHTYCSSLLLPCKIRAPVATHLRTGRYLLGHDNTGQPTPFSDHCCFLADCTPRQGLFSLLMSKGMTSSHATISNYYVLTQESSQGNLLSALPAALCKDLSIFLSKWPHMRHRS